MSVADRIFNPSFGRFLLRTERAIRRLGLATAAVFLPALIGVRLIEIVLRGVLNKPGSLFNAMEGELFVMFIFMAIATAYLHNSHVRVDIFRDRFSRRTKSLIEIFGTLLFVLPVSLIVIWYGIDMTYSTYSDGERAAVALGAPARWVIVATVPLGIGLFCIAVLARTARHIGYLLTRQTAND